jgi:holo-[acyl-carrier protein] synthase
MITGIGTDVVEISRIRDSHERFGDRFLRRIFTQPELDYAMKKKDPFPSLAVRFAAKEAFAKAIRAGSGNTLAWTDVAVYVDASGVPHLSLSASLGEVLRNARMHVSLSHSRRYAVATVVIEKGPF